MRQLESWQKLNFHIADYLHTGSLMHWIDLSDNSFFDSVTVARPAPPDAPLVSTPLVGESVFYEVKRMLFY